MRDRERGIGETPVIPLAAYRGLLDEVAARIRARIFSGELHDGQRIVERDLATDMGTSRGPIRDALRILEHEGLVITSSRRGTHVASLTSADALEILAIREALEPVAVNFLLDRNVPQHLELLEAVVDRLDRAALTNDWNLAILLDLEFHGLLFRALRAAAHLAHLGEFENADATAVRKTQPLLHRHCGGAGAPSRSAQQYPLGRSRTSDRAFNRTRRCLSSKDARKFTVSTGGRRGRVAFSTIQRRDRCTPAIASFNARE